MSRGKRKTVAPESKPIEQYTHADKDRAYIPPAGLSNYDSQEERKQTYAYDPHLDPQLQWAGKAERTSFEVPTVSLHVHERIDPRTIIEAVRKKEEELQPSLFERTELPLRKAIEFYKHRQNWTNRLIAGDSLLVMNSLLVKEGMAGQVQMIYFDPPYGIKYGSNFQPFVNKRDVKDGKDEDLTQEPETLKAFRDTWELGIHSYLTYLRDRFLLARELLHESGSVFVQISDENVHLVRNLMDEVFGKGNFVALISFQKTGGLVSKGIVRTVDYICWYGKDISQTKIFQLFLPRKTGDTSLDRYDLAHLPNGTLRRLTKEEMLSGELPPNARRCRQVALESANPTFPFEFRGKVYIQRWKTNLRGLEQLAAANRLVAAGTRNAARRSRSWTIEASKASS